MRHTAGGWVHAETGQLTCETVLNAPLGPAKVRWPHIERHPHSISHLRDIVARLESPMMPNTKAAVIACLNELLRLLDQQNARGEPDGGSPKA